MPKPALPYEVRQLNPAHPDLPDAAGVPARLASEAYVEALGRLLFYWGYPAVNTMGRTAAWDAVTAPGVSLGLFPAAPRNQLGYLDDYMPPGQRKIVTPNNDTIYGAGFADLGREPAVVQTPSDVPPGHYWTVQLADLFTTVFRQLGSAAATPGGKFLLVGPDWRGEAPEGFVEVIRAPTNVAMVGPRSFTAHSPAAKAQARAVLNQIGMVPLSQDKPGRLAFDCEAVARNKIYPPGLTAEMVADDPDMLRALPVDPVSFWDDLEKALAYNPTVSADDAPMAAQARTLIALRKSDPAWRALLDRTALAADAELHRAATYAQAGVEAGGGWQRQENGGLWGTDWFGRALAAVVYIYVNDFHEAVYFIRATDADGALLHGRYRYAVSFPKGGLPPVDRARGSFWSLTLYDKDYFMLPDTPNGRTNVGTVNLDADELVFADDGSLTLIIASDEPADAAERANWLPAPKDNFALIVRAYVPTKPILDGAYTLPNVRRLRSPAPADAKAQRHAVPA